MWLYCKFFLALDFSHFYRQSEVNFCCIKGAAAILPFSVILSFSVTCHIVLFCNFVSLQDFCTELNF